MLGKKQKNAMLMSHVDSHVNMGHLMSTWDFFQKAMLGKKCHVDMRCPMLTWESTWDISWRRRRRRMRRRRRIYSYSMIL
jgi:hypothetical protein